MEHSLTLDSESLIHRWTLGYHYALLGRFGEAAQQADFMSQRAPQMPYTLQLRALIAGAEGRKDEALMVLANVNTDVLDGHTRFHIAEGFALGGNVERALKLIEDAVLSNFYPHTFIAAYNPFLDSLRGTPEFERILDIAEQRMLEFRGVATGSHAMAQ